MKKILFYLFAIVLVSTSSAQKKYKQMMQDNNINFYDVVTEAENYFKNHHKGKGSGWKPFQRWKNANEYKYAPSGRRDNIDPFFVKNAYNSFLKNNNAAMQKQSTFTGWKELGPFTVNNITGNYSVGLGRIEDFYVNPANPDIIYIGSRSGGFWKTIDGGANWQGGSTDFLAASGVNAIAVNPDNNNIIINIQNGINTSSHGIYKSTDGGNTWVITPFNSVNLGKGGLGSNWNIRKIKYHPRVSNLVFISARDGLYRSTDNLQTWTKITTGSISEIEFHPTDNNIIYIYDNYYWAANKNIILRSTDMGVTFTQSNTIAGNNNNRSVHLSVTKDNCNDCLYFASDNGVWKSTDKGINFTFLSNPTESCGGFSVNDLDKTKMIYGYLDVDRTTDEGQTWVDATKWSLGSTNGTTSTLQTSFNTSTNYVHADLHPAKSINGVFYIGTDGFFCKSSNNGENWEILSQGVATRENYKLGVSQSNTERSISGSQDNGTAIKTKNGWIEFYGADGMEAIIHPLNDDWMIGSLQNGGRRRTKNGGQTQNGITPTAGGAGAWEAPICYDPNNQMTVYDFRTAVFKTEDFGDTWTTQGTPTFNAVIKQAAVAQNNSNILVVTQSDNIEKSINGGVTWSNIKGTLPSYAIQSVAFDPNDDDTILVTYARFQNDNKKVFISTDGGTTWSNITYNLGNMPIHTVVVDHTPARNIYLGSEIGVYTKPMNGNTWSLYNSNLPNTSIEELEIVYGSNRLKAATWGRGLWEYSLVGRNNYPAILTTKITDQPTLILPKETVDQFVTSTIDYAGTLTNVEVKWSINTPVFDNTIAMSNTTGNTWVSNTAIPNFPQGTKIFFKVFATGNNNDTSQTYKFMYTITPFEYCSAASGDGGYEHITNVTFNSINNNSGVSTYTDFTTINTTVNQGNTYNFSVTYSKAYPADQVTVWIDFNKNASFGDAGEEFIFPAGSGTNSPYNQDITIPLNAKIGVTQMRVRLNDTANSSNPTPCGNSRYGEVEDYSITIANVLDVADANFKANLKVYPNPTNGKLHISLGDTYKTTKIKLTSILGQTIFKQEYNNINTIDFNIKAASGIYFLTVTSDGKKAVLKIAKQ